MTIADVEAIVASRIPEGPMLDYKLLLDISTPESQGKVATDLVALTNAHGGQIVCGIRCEDEGDTSLPAEIVGFEIANPDQLRLAINDICRQRITPILPGVEAHVIPFGDRFVVVIAVPQSWVRPHAVHFPNNGFRFYRREGSSNTSLDYPQTRQQFIDAHTRTSARSQWYQDRQQAIAWNDFEEQLDDGIKVCLHVLPVAGMEGSFTVDPLTVPGRAWNLCDNLGIGDRPVYMLDGVYYADRERMAPYADDSPIVIQDYIAVFRNGAVEVVWTDRFRRGFFNIESAEYVFLKWSHHLTHKLWEIGVHGPIDIHCSVQNTKGVGLLVGDTRTETNLSHNRIVLPSIRKTQGDDLLGFSRDFKQAYDVMWQAFGKPRARNFHENGTYAF